MLCPESIQNGRYSGQIWYICLTLNPTVKGVDVDKLCTNKILTDYSRVVCQRLSDTVLRKCHSRPHPSIHRWLLCSTWDTPTSGESNGIRCRWGWGCCILLRRDALEILPDEINEVYIWEGSTTCRDINTKNEDDHRKIVPRDFVNVKIFLGQPTNRSLRCSHRNSGTPAKDLEAVSAALATIRGK